MSRTQFKYPPCSINVMTEKPYPRHHWVAKGSRAKLVKKGSKQEVIHYMRVVCSRCGISDPRAPLN